MPATYDPVRTSVTLASGCNFDLLNPKPELVDFRAIVQHLAKVNRYCGATPGVAYSVAEHSVRCAQAALSATKDLELASYLLCHDMHEALLGDDTTPKKRALGVIISSFGLLAGAVEQAFQQLTDRIDTVIHARAGLAWPMTPEMAKAVHHWDRVLLATEWRDLMCCPPPYDFGVAPLPGRIRPHDTWELAALDMESFCEELLGMEVLNSPRGGAAPS